METGIFYGIGIAVVLGVVGLGFKIIWAWLSKRNGRDDSSDDAPAHNPMDGAGIRAPCFTVMQQAFSDMFTSINKLTDTVQKTDWLMEQHNSSSEKVLGRLDAMVLSQEKTNMHLESVVAELKKKNGD